MGRINNAERYAAYSLAALAFLIGGTACGGKSISTSPATNSRAYPGDPNAYGSDPLNWHEVVVADTQLPEPITNADMVVGFEVPGSDDWHESKPIELDSPTSGEILLRIGPGPVEFRVQLQGKNTKFTKLAPRTTFEGPEPYSQAIKNPEVRVPDGWEH